MTYHVWIGGSCDYGHKERAGGAAVVIEPCVPEGTSSAPGAKNEACRRDVIADLHTTEFRMMLTLMVKVMGELPEGSDILFLSNAAYIQNFDKTPTPKSANPDLIAQCIAAKQRHHSVQVRIVPYHKSPLLKETHDASTEAMKQLRKAYNAERKSQPGSEEPMLHEKTFGQLTTTELYELLRVRSEVFVVEQDCVYQDLDNDDQQAIHLWLTIGDRTVALARVCPAETHMQEVSIGRVITTERGKGYGKRIMRHAIEAAVRHFHAVRIEIEAQEYADGFYEKVGFQRVSDTFLLDGIPHIKMTWTNNKT